MPLPPSPPLSPVPDSQGTSGWLITEERWDKMCVSKGVSRNKYLDNTEFAAALAAHPDMTLEDYNQVRRGAMYVRA